MVETQSDSFRVIGYVTTSVLVENIPFDKLTHINYAFLIPNSDGTFKTEINESKLDRIVQEAKSHDVKVLISVGGWGPDEEFEELATIPERRAIFIDKLVEFSSEHQLDGIDLDWEYPDQESRIQREFPGPDQ
jgi:GH18 family chitinase